MPGAVVPPAIPPGLETTNHEVGSSNLDAPRSVSPCGARGRAGSAPAPLPIYPRRVATSFSRLRHRSKESNLARNVAGVVAGLAGWLLIASVAGFVMRMSWPAYASVASAMTFTLPMMIARLSIGVIATLSMERLTGFITRSVISRLIPGVFLLAIFIPQHLMLWDKFPLWYHLSFLLSLVPLTYAGGRIADLGSSRDISSRRESPNA